MTSVEEMLERPGKLGEEIRALEGKAAMLEEAAKGHTSVLSLSGGGGGGYTGSRMENLLIRAADLQEKAKRLRREREEAVREICLMLAKLDSPEQAQVLMLHYVKGVSFRRIGRMMGYTERNVYYLRRKGVEELALKDLLRGVLKD